MSGAALGTVSNFAIFSFKHFHFNKIYINERNLQGIYPCNISIIFDKCVCINDYT